MTEENTIPIEPTEEQTESEELEIVTDQIEALERERKISITFYRLFGTALIVLSSIIIPLVIVTYFYHPSQPDQTALLIEQIIGYILAGFGLTLGTILLLSAKRLKNEPIAVVEPLEENAQDIIEVTEELQKNGEEED